MRDSEFYKFIVELCQQSGDLIRRYFAQGDVAVETKSNQTPVTIADREAESLLREMIQRQYPSHGIIGEEYGTENETAEFVWTLDPIDGTISFVGGVPLFGTLISLMHEGRPILGAIHQPILEQLCVGDGNVTELNEQVVTVRECSELEQATILATDIVNVDTYQNKAAFEELVRRGNVFRTWGDCYGYLLLVMGKADVMLDPIMNPWDLLPLIPIVRGAGGTITSWDGEDPVKATSCVAAGAALHKQVISTLQVPTKAGSGPS